MAVALAPLIFGMTLGFTSPASDTMQDTVQVNGVHVPAPSNLVVFSRDGDTSAEGSSYASFVNLGACAGALLGGPVADKIGRKKAMLLQAPMFFLSWLLTSMLSSFTPLLLARMLLGVACGMCTSTVPTYISEVAPTELRGAFGAVFQVACVIGIMLVNLLGASVFTVESQGHTFCEWRYLSSTGCVFAAVFFAATLAVPESPVWLASKGHQAEAKKVLARLRGGAEFVEVELATLNDSSNNCDDSSSNALRDLWNCRKAFSIGLVLMLIQQMSGVNAVIFFQDTIFQDANMSNPAFLGFMVMTLQVVMTAVSVPLMDTAGRKVLLLTSTVGMCFCCIGMVIFFEHKTPGWLAMICSFAYIAFFSLGLGPIPWLMMGELFPTKIRSSGSSAAAAFNWLCSFTTTKTVSLLQQEFTFSGVFGLYGVVVALGSVYVVLKVPETKGKSFAEIEELIEGSRREIPLNSPLNA
eukprot:TRINITY_DN49990_c0_g1_i1.p1 TRINITY_DN49990_c0_g1~~TRINITY_DN49990_c0_g1_i1.p1  ORF type:complete len:509 (+),score=77.03 TRINITY_DN49990_c0_g1_i1:125-1528(+)